jgi:HD superfamily phosphohydrolase YqeK
LVDLPDPVLHGPAAAEQLRIDGVMDGELLRAISGHTVGDPDFGLMGRALYCADFLEPGRSFLTEWREDQRGRMPSEVNVVAREIAGSRIGNVVERGGTILPRTVAFWNRLVEDAL